MNPLLIRRRGMMKAQQGGLPAGYTLLEYITNPNNGYIQTNVILSRYDTIKTRYDVVYRIGSHFIFRCRKPISDTDTSHKNFSIGYAGSECYMNQSVRIFASRTGITTLEYENQIYRLVENGGTYDASSQVYGEPFLPMTLLGIVENGTAQNFFHDAFYYFTVDGKIDLVAVKNNNNEVGMYDLLGRQFYASANGNAFVAGPIA